MADDKLHLTLEPNDLFGCATCSNPSCKQPHKLQSEFYFKKTENRYESVCKTCKRDRRKSNVQKDGSTKLAQTTQCRAKKRLESSIQRAKRIIEPAGTASAAKTKTNPTAQIINRADFSDMEKSCDRKMTDFEKFDAVQRLNEFVEILKDELGRNSRSDIYVIKDK